MRTDLPTGTVTFLFTDVEGSTKLLRKLGAEGYAQALAEHRRIVREACTGEGGVEVDMQGDAFFVAFPSAPGAASAAQAIRDALAPGMISLRIGLHTGTPLVTDEGYVGDDVHFASRVAASGHGGQVLLSKSARDLVEGLSVIDLGEHRLKDIEGVVLIYQLGDDSFPPLKTISNTNLPRPASSFVGREREREDVVRKLQSGTRLLTLTGPGGSGKTRLALEAAAELVPAYKAGVFWIGLAALREPSLVTETIAQTLGAKDGLVGHIGEREMLLLLDNLEQVIEASPDLSSLVAACPNLALLVTSRELLRVQGEVEYSVPPLASAEAVSLFCERSRLEATAEIAELCSRLDDLPLAVELAAARTSALSPAQILERLASRLDLFKGGRDADPRQATLRATIAWSYDLLSQDEQRLFRVLSVFAGGCTLDAANEVAGADLDTLQLLVEKSLLRFSNERYWMLETIREYAGEELEDVGGTADTRGRHANAFLARLEEAWRKAMPPTPSMPELQAWYGTEADNLRATVDYLSRAAPKDAAWATAMLFWFWKGRGAYGEARQQLQTAVAFPELTDETRAGLLARLAEMHERLGDLDSAEATAAESLRLSAPATRARSVALLVLSSGALYRGDVEESIRLARQAACEAEGVDAMTRISALGDLGDLLARVGRHAEARSVIVEAVEDARRRGFPVQEAWGSGQLGLIDVLDGNYESARPVLEAALVQARNQGHYVFEVEMLNGLGYAYLGLGRRGDARACFSECLERGYRPEGGVSPDLVLAMSGVALSVEPVDCRQGARLRGAIAELRQDAGSPGRTTWQENVVLERRFEEPLVDALGKEAYSIELGNGAGMSIEETIDFARGLAD